ncbi:hypothetical protein [Pseudoalteromonas sp. MSK9-3]|uniref:hypothetical protein n=1 Tax=Pseudoalteromonas sp. MSK9-3 TaxID=1897633 RepID=UPI000E6B6D49|nr:hypothetical protein [Pseudoalteromonas sp. MSK9-3]
MFKKITAIALLLNSLPSLAENFNWKLEVGTELRHFEKKSAFNTTDTTISAHFEPEFRYESQQGTDIYTGRLFSRVDSEDSQRSHIDIRELSWLHIIDNSDIRIGISRVFWGVTESQHLVDVINQTDLVENPDGEDKLGQPLIQWTHIYDWGSIDLYALLGFRERRFPGTEGRFRTEYPIINDAAYFETSNKKDNIDLAIRYSHTISNWDFAFSHFSGTNRTPTLKKYTSDNTTEFVPHYFLLEQTGFVSQYVNKNWLWKLELISAVQENNRYTASTFGFEYTHVGLFDSQIDVGWLIEYSFDDRGTAGPSSFEHDWFSGWRFVGNDPQSTEALIGLTWDQITGENTLSLEASTRIGNNLKITFEARSYGGANKAAKHSGTSDKLLYLNSESYAQFLLAYYF